MMALARKAAPCCMPPSTMQWLSFNILHGRGTELVKMDLKDAFQMVSVHPQDHQLLDIQRDSGDHSLPFWLCSAP